VQLKGREIDVGSRCDPQCVVALVTRAPVKRRTAAEVLPFFRR
jgi:hypothetical protein